MDHHLTTFLSYILSIALSLSLALYLSLLHYSTSVVFSANLSIRALRILRLTRVALRPAWLLISDWSKSELFGISLHIQMREVSH